MASKMNFDLIVFEKYKYEITSYQKMVGNLNPRSLRALFTPNSRSSCHVVMVVGDVGLGKTEIAKQLKDIACKRNLQDVWIDWRNESKKYPERFKQENNNIENLLHNVYSAFRDEDYGKYFTQYEKDYQLLQETEAKFTQAIESTTVSQQNPEAFENLRKLSSSSIRWLVGKKILGPAYDVVPDWFKSLADDAISETMKAMAIAIATAKLSKKELDIYLNGTDRLLDGLAKGINEAANAKPITIILDHYELIQDADAWFRYLIRKSGQYVVWVIVCKTSSSSKLLDNYRDDPFLCKDLIDIRLCPLTIDEVAVAINHHPTKTREATPGEVKDVYNLTRGNPLALSIALELWFPGCPEGVGKLAPPAQRSQVVTPVFEQYMSNALSQEQDKNVLTTLAFCYDQREDLLKSLLGDNALAIIQDLEKRYRYLFQKPLCLTESAKFWLREELFLKDIYAKEFQSLAKLATDWWFEQLTNLESCENDLTACVAKNTWFDHALATVYHCFWQTTPDTSDRVLTILRGLLFLPPLNVAAFIHSVWTVVGPLAEQQPRLCELIREIQHGVTNIVFQHEIPVGTNKLKLSGEKLTDENDHVIAELGVGSFKRAIDLLESGVKPGDPRYLAVQVTKARFLSTLGNYNGAAGALHLARRMSPINAGSANAKYLADNYATFGKVLLEVNASSTLALECLQTSQELYKSDDSVIYTNIAQAQFNLCNFEKAIEEAERALSIDKTLGVAYGIKGGAFNSLGRFDEAIDTFHEGLDKEKTPHIRSHLSAGLGIVYMNKGLYDQAEDQFDRALVFEPTQSAAMVGKGLLAQKRNPELALLEFKRAMEYLYFIDEYFASNLIRILATIDDDTAIEILESNLFGKRRISVSTHVVAMLMYEVGKRYTNKLQYDKALSYFQRTIQLTPRYLPAYFGAARVSRELRRPKEARMFLLDAFEMNLGMTNYYAKHIWENSLKSLSNKAIRRAVRDVPRAYRDSPEAYLQQGATELLIGNPGEALRFLNMAARNSNDFFVHYLLSIAEAERGHFENAAKHAEKAIVNVDEAHKGFAYYSLAKMREAQGEYEKAVEVYRLSLKHFNSNYRLSLTIRSDVLFEFAFLLYRLGEEEEAFHCLEEAFAIDPYNWPGRLSRIILLMRSGEETEARLELRRLERDTNWSKELETLKEGNWKSQDLYNSYADFVAETIIRPVLMGALITGDEPTVNEILKAISATDVNIIDYTHPLYSLAPIAWPDVLPEIIAKIQSNIDTTHHQQIEARDL